MSNERSDAYFKEAQEELARAQQRMAEAERQWAMEHRHGTTVHFQEEAPRGREIDRQEPEQGIDHEREALKTPVVDWERQTMERIEQLQPRSPLREFQQNATQEERLQKELEAISKERDAAQEKVIEQLKQGDLEVAREAMDELGKVERQKQAAEERLAELQKQQEQRRKEQEQAIER